ncbi:hypothetical protein N7540_010585 [Penicillium herquei]|nr:hypothetical protein N7540_010585 [Penicillium herquei]
MSTLGAEATRHSKKEHEHIHDSEISSIDKADMKYSLNTDGLLEMRDQQDNLVTHPARERDEPIYRQGEEATVPCPMAEEDGCNEKFASQEGADRHARNKHGFSAWDLREGTVPCLLAEQTHCRRMFRTEDLALGHAFKKHKTRFGEYHCPEDGCNIVLFELGKCEEHLRGAHGFSSGLSFIYP